MHPLRNKVVLITGGSSGVGRATALRLAGLGARVAVAARRRPELEAVVQEAARLGAEALAAPADVTDSDQCRLAVEATVSKFGRLDILLCCAGQSMRAYFDGSALAAMEQVMRVNYLGTLYTTYFAVPHIKRSRGSLVAISSLTGKRGTPTYAAYGASKFAVEGLYEALRLELRRDGVHVGILSPGFIDTPLRDNVLGPDGQPWRNPPPVPFNVWPVERCVDRIIALLVKRRRDAMLTWFVRPALLLDQLLGRWLGDRILEKKLLYK